MPNHHYNKHLSKYAHENRASLTKAEACLWKYALGRRQMLGWQFRRQRPIANYIADFVCLPLMLIVEVDGYSHQVPENAVKDMIRQRALENLGFTVIRFKDNEVLTQINSVREQIEGWIMKLSEMRNE